jgi:hypothetical protein
MEIIYLILAQAYPDQLLKLVDALQDSSSVFIIHVDKGQMLKIFSSFFKEKNIKNVYFLKDRYSTETGGFNLVKAILNGLKYIYKRFSDTTNRVVLLKGQDYPIKSKEYIHSYFNADPNNIFIRYFPYQDTNSLNKANNRLPFN